MALMVNILTSMIFFFTGDLLSTSDPPLSPTREGLKTDHRGLYQLRTRYYSKLEAGG